MRYNFLLSIICLLSVGCASAQTPIKIETYKWVNDTTLWIYTTGGDSMRMEFVTGAGHHILGSVANRLFSTGGWEQDLPVVPQPTVYTLDPSWLPRRFRKRYERWLKKRTP